jgi:hypothetical protein
MGIKKERKHINLVGRNSIGIKTAKASTRSQMLRGGRKSGPPPRPTRPGGR